MAKSRTATEIEKRMDLRQAMAMLPVGKGMAQNQELAERLPRERWLPPIPSEQHLRLMPGVVVEGWLGKLPSLGICDGWSSPEKRARRQTGLRLDRKFVKGLSRATSVGSAFPVERLESRMVPLVPLLKWKFAGGFLPVICAGLLLVREIARQAGPAQIPGLG
jgi:hypothetical protein